MKVQFPFSTLGVARVSSDPPYSRLKRTGPLPYYRLYHVRGGHFARFNELEATDDVAAVRQARPLLEVDPAELWCGRRKVTTFNNSEVPS